jgi:hypothetical protein
MTIRLLFSRLGMGGCEYCGARRRYTVMREHFGLRLAMRYGCYDGVLGGLYLENVGAALEG